MIGRTKRLLHALATHPGGLSTPQVAHCIAEEARPWQQALTRCGEALRRQEQMGRVTRSGTIPGRWQQGPAVIWQITDHGAELVRWELMVRLRYLRQRRARLAAELARIDAEIEELAADEAVLTRLMARYEGVSASSAPAAREAPI